MHSAGSTLSPGSHPFTFHDGTAGLRGIFLIKQIHRVPESQLLKSKAHISVTGHLVQYPASFPAASARPVGRGQSDLVGTKPHLHHAFLGTDLCL